MDQIESCNRDLWWYIPYISEDAEEGRMLFKAARADPLSRLKQVCQHVGGPVVNEYRIHVLGSAATLVLTLRLVGRGSYPDL